MKWHVFAATALLFLVTLACRNRTPMKTYDAEPSPAATLEPPKDDESADNATITKKMKMIDTIAATRLPRITTPSTLKSKGPKPKLDGFDYPGNALLIESKTMPAFAKDHQLMA